MVKVLNQACYSSEGEMLHHLENLSFRLKSSTSIDLQIFGFLSFIRMFLIFAGKESNTEMKKMHFIASLGFVSDGIFYGRVH